MAARFRIACHGSRRIGQGVRGLSPKARFPLVEEGEYRVDILCVSFECDPLSEELRKEETELAGKSFGFLMLG